MSRTRKDRKEYQTYRHSAAKAYKKSDRLIAIRKREAEAEEGLRLHRKGEKVKAVQSYEHEQDAIEQENNDLMAQADERKWRGRG